VTDESSAEFVALKITINMPRRVELWKNKQGHKTHQVQHI